MHYQQLSKYKLESKVSSKLVKHFENNLNQRIFGSRILNHGNSAAITFYCKRVIMWFSQLFCSPNHGSDVVVRAFVLHSVELCSITLSIHANDFKNSVC